MYFTIYMFHISKGTPKLMYFYCTNVEFSCLKVKIIPDRYLEMKPICNGHKHSKMEKNIAFIIQFGKIKHTSKRCLLS